MKTPYLILSIAIVLSLAFMLGGVSADGLPIYEPTPVVLHQGWNGFGIILNSSYQLANDSNVTIPLASGFNLIGYSSPNTSLVSNIVLQDSNKNNYTYSQAITRFNLTINSTTNTTTKGLTPTSFSPHGAYWFSVNESCNLTFVGVGGTNTSASIKTSNTSYYNGTFYTSRAAIFNNTIPSTGYYYDNGYVPISLSSNFVSFNSWRGYFINMNLVNPTLFLTNEVPTDENDTNTPIFSNNTDNNRTLINTGNGTFNVTVNQTNGTVILNIDNTNISATTSDNVVYLAQHTFSSAGNYPYYWSSYGSGVYANYNQSDVGTYTIILRSPACTPATIAINGMTIILLILAIVLASVLYIGNNSEPRGLIILGFGLIITLALLLPIIQNLSTACS